MDYITASKGNIMEDISFILRGVLLIFIVITRLWMEVANFLGNLQENW